MERPAGRKKDAIVKQRVAKNLSFLDRYLAKKYGTVFNTVTPGTMLEGVLRRAS